MNSEETCTCGNVLCCHIMFFRNSYVCNKHGWHSRIMFFNPRWLSSRPGADLELVAMPCTHSTGVRGAAMVANPGRRVPTYIGDRGCLFVRSSVGWALVGALFLTDQLPLNRQTDMLVFQLRAQIFCWKEFLSHSHTEQANGKVKASLCPDYYIVDIAILHCLHGLLSCFHFFCELALHQHQFLCTRAGIGKAVE